MAIAITAVVAVLSPFIVLVGSAAVIVTAFAVAGAGTLLVLGGLAAGFAGIGAAILALGGGGGIGAAAALTTATDKLTSAQEALVEFDQEHTKQLTILQQHQREQLVENIANAQNKYNDALARSQGPTGVLIGQLSAMKDAWTAQAGPLAVLITQFAGGFIPVVQQAGSAVMSWFGDRLPLALSAIGAVFNDLLPDFTSFGTFLGRFFDSIASMSSIGPGGTIVTLGGVFENFARLAMGAVQNLLTVLGQLSQWFLERLPVYGPIVAQVFGFLGNAVLGIFSTWGRFADWLVTQWPTITDIASRAAKSMGDAWTAWGPVLQQFITGYGPTLVSMLKFVADNSGAIVPIITLLLMVFGALSIIILGVVGALEMLISKLEALQKYSPFNLLSAINNGISLPKLPSAQDLGTGVTRLLPGGGGGSTQTNNNITINGATDPQATARAVTRALRGGQQV